MPLTHTNRSIGDSTVFRYDSNHMPVTDTEGTASREQQSDSSFKCEPKIEHDSVMKSSALASSDFGTPLFPFEYFEQGAVMKIEAFGEKSKELLR